MRVCGLLHWDACLISHSYGWHWHRILDRHWGCFQNNFCPPTPISDSGHISRRMTSSTSPVGLSSHSVQCGSSYKERQMKQLTCYFLLRKSQTLCEVFKVLRDLMVHIPLALPISFKFNGPLALYWMPQGHWRSLTAQSLYRWHNPRLPLTGQLLHEVYSHQLSQNFLSVWPLTTSIQILTLLFNTCRALSKFLTSLHFNFHIYKMDIKIVSSPWGL